MVWSGLSQSVYRVLTFSITDVFIFLGRTIDLNAFFVQRVMHIPGIVVKFIKWLRCSAPLRLIPDQHLSYDLWAKELSIMPPKQQSPCFLKKQALAVTLDPSDGLFTLTEVSGRGSCKSAMWICVWPASPGLWRGFYPKPKCESGSKCHYRQLTGVTERD